jgi:hypothetical protein
MVTDLPHPVDAVGLLITRITDQGTTIRPADLVASTDPALDRPGMYSWWADDEGAHALSRGLQHDLAPGLIYAGLAGATRRRSQRRSRNTLRGRLVQMHLGGRFRMSTFRYSLGSVLAETWGESTIDEARLSAWMYEHLLAVAVPVADADSLEAVEDQVLAELDPALNLRKVPRTALRRRVSELRKRHPRK